MSVVGIIAEYNPFHNGHLYHLQRAKELTSAEATICIMSGNFVQRGEPAVVDKWARAEMALRSGADLVFELPFCFAARSAYNFARGAVQLLDRIGVVDYLCFGCEIDNLELLEEIASVICEEPDEFRLSLKTFLSTGNSFPVARAKAISQYFESHYPRVDPNTVLKILTGPNNILAVEYLRVLKEERSSIRPVLVPRRGAHYHDANLTGLASATAIRKHLSINNHQDLALSLPAPSLKILQREFATGRGPVFEQAMDPILLALLRRISSIELAEIYDVTEGLENRIKKAARQSNSLAELKYRIKTKRYNLTRINRILLYVLMNVTKAQIRIFDQTGPTYLHLLGFSPLGQKILLKMKSNCRIFLLNRVKNVNKYLPGHEECTARRMLDLDLLATDIYSLFLATNQRKGGKDYTTSPIFIQEPDV